MKLYLVRHGQTTGDLEDRFGGDYEDALTDYGKDQVRRRAKSLQRLGLKAIISSPRIRAQQSAHIIGRALGLPVVVMHDWRERNFYGTLTGMTKKEAQAKHPDLVPLTSSYQNALPRGEKYEPFKKRILNVLKRTIGLRKDPLLVVAHGGPLTCIARELLGKEIKVHDCAMLTLDVTETGVQLLAMDKAEFKK